MAMMLLAAFSWWYTEGWARQANRISRRIEGIMEAFSITLLARTLFSPFRQISAGSVAGPLNTQVRALGDRLFSRIFGAFVRSVVIAIGLVGALLAAMVGLIELLLWPLLPFLPAIGIGLALSGWTPL